MLLKLRSKGKVKTTQRAELRRLAKWNELHLFARLIIFVKHLKTVQRQDANSLIVSSHLIQLRNSQ